MTNDKQSGLYRKYYVTRTDGKLVTNSIVLEFKDANARKGIAAFSQAVREDGYELLANDIDIMLETWDLYE